jgi:hypothetical protein
MGVVSDRPPVSDRGAAIMPTIEKISVDRLASRFVRQIGHHVAAQLTAYMKLPHQLNQMNAEMIASGQLDVNDQHRSEHHLWRQARLFESISYIGYALIEGKRETGAGRWVDGVNLAVYENFEGQASDYATDAQGDRTHLIQTYEFDPVSPDRLQRIRQAGQPIWTEIYISDDIHNVQVAAGSTDVAVHNLGYQNYIAINAESPLYGQDGELMGVMIVDVLLNAISLFLSQLQTDGQIFIMERDGRLVGCSHGQSILTPDRTDRLQVLDVSDPVMRATAAALRKQEAFPSIDCDRQFSFRLGEQRQFVHVQPWRDEYGLDWLLVVSASEAELAS